MRSKSRCKLRYRAGRGALWGIACTLGWALPAGGLANDLKVGAPAPPAELVTLQGEHIHTADLKGQVLMLHFWATWCGPCRIELPALSSYAKRHAGDGLRVIGVSADSADRLAQVTRMAAQLSFPVALLSGVKAPGYGRIWKLPVTFIIDRDGRLVVDGWKDQKSLWSEQRLEQVVTPLLAYTLPP